MAPPVSGGAGFTSRSNGAGNRIIRADERARPSLILSASQDPLPGHRESPRGPMAGGGRRSMLLLVQHRDFPDKETVMIHTGDVIHNSITGETIRFVETAADT